MGIVNLYCMLKEKDGMDRLGLNLRPLKETWVHAFNIHNYLSGVSMLKKKKHLFQGSQR